MENARNFPSFSSSFRGSGNRFSARRRVPRAALPAFLENPPFSHPRPWGFPSTWLRCLSNGGRYVSHCSIGITIDSSSETGWMRGCRIERGLIIFESPPWTGISKSYLTSSRDGHPLELSRTRSCATKVWRITHLYSEIINPRAWHAKSCRALFLKFPPRCG